MSKLKITLNDIKKVTSYANPKIASEFADMFNKHAAEFGLTTPMRVAHFIAQLAHESDHFKTTREYNGERKRYAPFFGRGLIQLTHDYNYREFYEWCINRGLDIPEIFRPNIADKAAYFPWAFWSSVWYWDKHKLNVLADDDKVREITRKINGGYNGLEDRINLLNNAKRVLGVKSVPAVDTKPGTIVSKFTVREVQEALVKHGYRITVDGKMGPNTLAAVKLFQKMNDLVPDGIIGPKTAEKLFK